MNGVINEFTVVGVVVLSKGAAVSVGKFFIFKTHATANIYKTKFQFYTWNFPTNDGNIVFRRQNGRGNNQYPTTSSVRLRF